MDDALQGAGVLDNDLAAGDVGASAGLVSRCQGRVALAAGAYLATGLTAHECRFRITWRSTRGSSVCSKGSKAGKMSSSTSIFSTAWEAREGRAKFVCCQGTPHVLAL